VFPSPCGPPIAPMGSSGLVSLTLTTVPSAGAKTGSLKPYQDSALLRIAFVGAPVDELHEVDGVALVGIFVVVAKERAASARRNRPLTGQWWVDGHRIGRGGCRCAPVGTARKTVPIATSTLVASCTRRRGTSARAAMTSAPTPSLIKSGG
jgi:hypothetical protein